VVAVHESRIKRLERIVYLLPQENSSGQGLSVSEILERLSDLYPESKVPKSRNRAVQRDLDDLCSAERIRKDNEQATIPRYRRLGDEDDLDPELWKWFLSFLSSQMKDSGGDVRKIEKAIGQLKKRSGVELLGDDKYRVLSDSMRLLPAALKADVVASVIRALAEGMVLEIVYRDRDGVQKSPEVHPLGLVQRGPSLYLFALKNGEHLRMYALHRMQSACVTAIPASTDTSFNLDDVIKNGSADFADGNIITLHAYVMGYVAELLYECQLNDSQQLIPCMTEEGFTDELIVNVPESGQLLRWILGFGPSIKVVGPVEWRNKIASQVRKTGALYE